MDSSSRLDVVKWLREQQEQKARKAVADARALEEKARVEEQRLRDAMNVEARAPGHAAMWELSDLSRSAGEKKLKVASEITKKAATVTTARQQVHLSAARGLKAVDNLLLTLMEEAKAEEQKKERKAADEWAVLAFSRTG